MKLSIISVVDHYPDRGRSIPDFYRQLIAQAELADELGYEAFFTAEHHFHPADSGGARCVACHMPARKYMGVHERRDHGFRVPRPELATKLGTPDVCTGCHVERTPAWAADVIAHRPGVHRPGMPHYGAAIWSGR